MPDDLTAAADLADTLVSSADPESSRGAIRRGVDELLAEGDSKGASRLMERVLTNFEELFPTDGSASQANELRVTMRVPLSTWLLDQENAEQIAELLPTALSASTPQPFAAAREVRRRLGITWDAWQRHNG